ncbi:3748_t:CDS:1 [Ambispora gerdemannii]|uniref:3748_t:CDS:1 n=1 Tax=Ambispora gerdemannii TaxID=144530 RepID=A0A9N9FEL1_9GLOM|nr:3748_t:CDS:1 [Ambispora gerdemannii]
MTSKVALLAAAISAITNEPVLSHDDYLIKKQNRRLPSESYPKYLFKGQLSVDSMHQSHLVGGQIDTFFEDHPTRNRNSGQHHIYVKTLTGQTIHIYPKLTYTIGKVKRLIQDIKGISPDQQRLVFSGIVLEDSRSLVDYAIKEEATLYLVLCLPGSGPRILFCSFLNSDQLDSRFDFDFTNVFDTTDVVFMRGNFQYKRPCGWNRIALKVLNKYGTDNAWLGATSKNFRQKSGTNEWPVSYHGTAKDNCHSIAEDGYMLCKGKRFAFGRGIYSTPDINVAARYAEKFTYDGQEYRVVIQNRVNPDTLVRISAEKTGYGEYWISPTSTDIRPYGICIKKV